MTHNGDHPPALYVSVMTVALVSVGHAAIFVRIADADPIVVAAFRLGIATLALAPVTLIFAYSDLRAVTRRQLQLIAGAAVFLALHFATWIASLDFTSIANSVVLVTLNPVWMALYGLIILRVQPGRQTWLRYCVRGCRQCDYCGG